MAERCVPGPLDSCSLVWTDSGATAPQNRMQGHVRSHPTGGLREVCTDDGKGLALCIYGQDTPTITPAPNQPKDSLAVTADGCVYAPMAARKRKTVPAVTLTSVESSQTMLSDSTLELDNLLGTVTACWEIRVDICNAWINCPTAGPATVTIPPNTVTATTAAGGGDIRTVDGGGTVDIDHTHSVEVVHSHGSINVTPATKATSSMALRVNNRRCEYLSADNEYNSHSGPIYHEVQVPAGTTLIVPIEVDITTVGNVEGFSAGTGELKVFYTPIACSEDC